MVLFHPSLSPCRHMLPPPLSHCPILTAQQPASRLSRCAVSINFIVANDRTLSNSRGVAENRGMAIAQCKTVEPCKNKCGTLAKGILGHQAIHDLRNRTTEGFNACGQTISHSESTISIFASCYVSVRRFVNPIIFNQVIPVLQPDD